MVSVSACGQGIDSDPSGDSSMEREPSADEQPAEEQAPEAPEASASKAFPQTSVEYAEINGTSGLLRSVGLCQLVAGYDAGAGLYRVTRMGGAPEVSGPTTYVELELLEAWSDDAPLRPVLAIPGGLASDRQALAVWTIEHLRQGEDIGVLLASPTADSDGYYRLYNLGLFQNAGTGFTNGQLFSLNPVSTSELGEIVGAAVARAGQSDCPDRQPEHSPSP
jgi:hypothetical protein